MSIHTRLRLGGNKHALTDTSVGGRASAVVELGEVGERALAGSVGLLTAPAELNSEATTAPEARGTALYGAARLDSTSFCVRVTAPRASGEALSEGFVFRLTMTRSADAPAADVAVADWMELHVVGRASTGEGLPALPGDFARIESGESWSYDIRLGTTLMPGQGRTMRFSETPTGKGWTVTFAELDAAGEPVDAGQVHTF